MLKRKCVWPEGATAAIAGTDADGAGEGEGRTKTAASCRRCASVGRPCLAQDTSISRRARKELGIADPQFPRRKGWQASKRASSATTFTGGQDANSTTIGMNNGALQPESSYTGYHYGAMSHSQPPVVPYGPSFMASPPQHPHVAMPAFSSANLFAQPPVPVAPAVPAFAGHGQAVHYYGMPPQPMPYSAPSPGHPSPGHAMSPPPIVSFHEPSASTPDIPWELVSRCVDTYFERVHFAVPYIHRDSFLRAIGGTTTTNGVYSWQPGMTIYGHTTPHALMYAIAATGLRFVKVRDISEHEWVGLGAAMCRKSVDLLSANLFSYPDLATAPMTLIEAAQALMVLNQFALGEGNTPAFSELLQRCGVVLSRLCFNPDGSFIGSTGDVPQSHIAWIHRELCSRLWIFSLSMNYATINYQMPIEPMFDYLARPFPLPSADLLFEMPALSDQKFRNWQLAPGELDRVVLDLSSLLTWPSNRAKILPLVNTIITSIFAQQAGWVSAYVIHTSIQTLRVRMRKFAEERSMDVSKIACQDPAQDNPFESMYRDFAQLSEAIIADVYSAMPIVFGRDLREGQVDSFFRHANPYFPDPRHAASFLGLLSTIECNKIESWVHGPPAKETSIQFFSSPAFASALESAVRFVKILDALLKLGTSRDVTHWWAVAGTLRVGFLDLALLDKMSSLEYSEPQALAVKELTKDLVIVMRYLERVSEIYVTFGEFEFSFRCLVTERASWGLTTEFWNQAASSPTLSRSSSSRLASRPLLHRPLPNCLPPVPVQPRLQAPPSVSATRWGSRCC